ncbi:hypothetical protein [Thalassotalea sp. Y01]|uniref:hypothetical protein n=1 Tax=Thalassotalea sp. Y01 TaxID=2729613 RepID=UPI00145D4A9B|nr:hypothetical protein [Thalassotalea sp. Y01]NMP15682.1 hypothetical protein [Thalassotalea sp. Y01]
MSIYLKFISGAFQPRSLFIPMASIILGTGLSALQWPVDGSLFASCIVLVIIAQTALNLAGNYQAAYVNHANATQQQGDRVALLRLSYAMAMLFAIGFILLLSVSVGFAMPSILLSLSLLIPFAITVRMKTLFSKAQLYQYKKVHMSFWALANGFLPCVIAFYLHTAHISDYSVAAAACAALLALLISLSKQALFIIEQHQLIEAGQLPQSLATNLKWQKLVVITTSLATAATIYWLSIPYLAGICILALPSIVATIATVEHLPEPDIASAQTTKVQIAYFAYWVLFIVGVML